MPMTEGYLTSVEQRTHYQATAKAKHGHYVIILRGYKGSPWFEKDYYIYDGENHVGTVAFMMTEIRKMFASGELELLRGAIPDTENRPGAVAQ